MKVCNPSKIVSPAFEPMETSPRLIKMGKGARNQRDPFHQAFLDERDRLRPQYLRYRTHVEKRRVQLMLLDWVERNNGYFVEGNSKNKNDLVVVQDQKRLLLKVAQALREPRKKALVAKSVPSVEKVMSIHLDLLVDDASVGMIVQQLREPFAASKAVHPTPTVPPMEQYHINHASQFDGSLEVDTILPDFCPVDDPDTMVTSHDDRSNATDPLMNDAASTNSTTQSVRETIDVEYYMNLSDDDLWLIAKELFD
jgi:hypothetical protein